MQFLPSELHELGYTDDDIAIIVGGNKNKNPHKEVNEFRKSSKRILICINMLSEGVDIPELSAAIFLTAVTAKQTTIQRIGRAIRLMDPHKTALIFMFADPAYISIAEEIEADITAEEVRLGRKTPVDRTPPSDGKFRRAEAIGISGGNLTTAMFNGQEDRVAAYKETQRRLKAKKLPWTFMHAALELLGVTNVTS
jgi:superfamily II DNA or RNA helicase